MSAFWGLDFTPWRLADLEDMGRRENWLLQPTAVRLACEPQRAPVWTRASHGANPMSAAFKLDDRGQGTEPSAQCASVK